MDKYCNMLYQVSQFPDNIEVVILTYGRQNEFIQKLAIFQCAVNFLKKEYPDIDSALNGNDVKMSTFLRFLEYIDVPYEKGTYLSTQVEKLLPRLEQEQEQFYPLTIYPCYILNRLQGNKQKIEELEDKIIKTDEISQQYKIIQEQIHLDEQRQKESLKDRYIEPDELFMKEKAIVILYYLVLQQNISQECHLQNDDSNVYVLTKTSTYQPREIIRLDTMDNVITLLKLLPKQSKEQLLNLFQKKSIDELESMTNNKEFINTLDSII